MVIVKYSCVEKKSKGVEDLLKVSGRTKLVFNMISKLIFAMVIGCTLMLTLLFISYKPTYEVSMGGEMLGYISNKKVLQDKIKDYLQKGDSDNVGYVILKEEPSYEFTFVKKETEMSDDLVLAKVKSNCDVYYRVYGVNVDNEEKFVVETIKEAQQLVDSINEKQKGFTKQANVQVSEKFVLKYDLLADVQVAVNNIVSELEKENNKVVKKNTTYSARTNVTVPAEILLALKESNAELNFTNPLVGGGIVTSRFGIRARDNHKGLDLAAKSGTPIHVAEDGIVTYAGEYYGYGNLVKVQHAAGYETYYGHCSGFNCNVGDSVSQGDVIAYVGSTGISTGPHVHFEVRVDGVAYNPEAFLSE